jgi:hypothetical protein
MGMDVIGLAPTAPEGRYFDCNISGWRLIADFIIETRPEIAACGSAPVELGELTVGGWHCNDGYGLDAESSVRLADALDEMLISGEAEAWCDKCNGSGSIPNPETYYRLNLDAIREFSAFARASGGFQIY